MYLHAIAHAVPAYSFTQEECWGLVQQSGALPSLKGRSAALLEKVLRGDGGIAKRHFASVRPQDLFGLGPGQLNAYFEKHAVDLAVEALQKALRGAGISASDLDGLSICTCTGYLCPGLTSFVAERVGLRSDAFLQDMVGLGCGAAIPTLRGVSHSLEAGERGRKIACIAVEVCSAAFYIDDDPGVLISLCLFGDGASASIWSNEAEQSVLALSHFDTLHQPENREYIRFVNDGGKLKNQLHRCVPEKVAGAVEHLYERYQGEPVHNILSHVGGKDVLLAIADRLPQYAYAESWQVLRDYGNLSSPSVLFALEGLLQQKPSSDQARQWMVSFGAGFACHSCLATLNAV